MSANTVARLQVLAGEMAEDFQDITLRDLRLRCVEVDEVWSFAERNNLTMRTGMRRFTRRTNAFSKRFRNHALAVALHFMHYNFCRVHQTIETTPAIKAGVADIGSGTVRDLADRIEALEPKPNRPKRYRKRDRALP